MTIKVYDNGLEFSNSGSNRKETNRIILHHAAGNGTVEQIHQTHKNNGWAGIGYHFYIRKDGKIYKGRPIDKMGAHCLNNNYDSIGICFEGNFCLDDPTEEQLKSGKELVSSLLKQYNLRAKKAVFGHKELMATACPGYNFPLKMFKKLSWKKSTIVYVKNTKEVSNTTKKYKKAIVTPNIGINVRESAGTNSKILKTKMKGSIVYVEESSIKTVNGTKWGKLKNGGWISIACVKWVS